MPATLKRLVPRYDSDLDRPTPLDDAARLYLNCEPPSRMSWWRWENEGILGVPLKLTKVNRRLRVRPRDLLAWLDAVNEARRQKQKKNSGENVK